MPAVIFVSFVVVLSRMECFDVLPSVQCFDTVTWVSGRAYGP